MTKPKNLNSKNETPSKYDEFKIFDGQYYKGMKVGGHHKWHYDQGVWKETKRTPDLWEMDFQVKKRRAGKAPKGSGVALGTEYHWLIIAQQVVRKLDENVYDTQLKGLKYKIGYKKPEQKWNISSHAKRKRIIQFLHEMLNFLEQEENEYQQEKLLNKKNKELKTKNEQVFNKKTEKNIKLLKKTTKTKRAK